MTHSKKLVNIYLGVFKPHILSKTEITSKTLDKLEFSFTTEGGGGVGNDHENRFFINIKEINGFYLRLSSILKKLKCGFRMLTIRDDMLVPFPFKIRK